jgi:hypothetical protein
MLQVPDLGILRAGKRGALPEFHKMRYINSNKVVILRDLYSVLVLASQSSHSTLSQRSHLSHTIIAILHYFYPTRGPENPHGQTQDHKCGQDWTGSS